MAQSKSVTPAPAQQTPSRALTDREPWDRIAARFVIAAAASAAVGLLWWLRQPRQLTGPIGIVGYPTWANFDYIPPFVAYRLAMYVFPAGVALGYTLLAWRGPLRRPASARRSRTTASMLDFPAAEPAAASVAGRVLSVAGRLLLPAMVVAVAASAASASSVQTITVRGLSCGLLYLAGVLVLAAALCWRRPRSGQPWWIRVRPAIPAVNGVAGAMAAAGGLWYVSRHSAVVVRADHTVHQWPWLPGWLAALTMLVIAAWAAARLRSGRPPVWVESRLLAVVVGSVAVFLITSRMPGQLGRFQGFDDAQSLAGANLLGKGYFPWRDMMFIHGLWADALQSTVGFSVFGDTRWGGFAGASVLLVPLCWVVLYLFAVWFARGNRWFLIGIALLLLPGMRFSPDVRFIFAPVILVLLGETLRRRSLGWCAAFMAALFSQAVLVPETLFLAVPALLAVVAADLTHRSAGSRIWPALRRSYWCAAVGFVLLAAWCAFLAVNHSLGAWIAYFKIFGPGHDAEGAIPPIRVHPWYWAAFGTVIALVLVTFWSAVARVRGGRPWSARDWVTVAAAGFAVLYGEKALGRFDAPHIDEVFTAALPLVLLWLEQALTAADGVVRRLASGARQSSPQRFMLAIRHPATILAAVIFAVTAAPVTGGSTVVAAADSIPAREHATAAAEPTIPRLGYAEPAGEAGAARGALDPALLHDLGTALDTYAGKSGPVFDMTNSPGYIYYLLDRRPASRFVHVSMAIPAYSQQLLIDDLRRSRPPVVIFDGNMTGLPSWDRVRNNIRHYDVSRYLLRGWQPILRTHGELLLLRNDLITRRPPVPRLIVPPVTANLWFSGSACDWGDVPNFLSSPASGSSLQLPVAPLGRRVVSYVQGWAVDPAARAPVRGLALVSRGKVLALVRPGGARRDLARTVGEYARNSGFSAQVARPPGGGPITVYGLTADGTFHPLAGQRGRLPRGVLTLPDGTEARVGAPIRGQVDRETAVTETIGVARIPAGVSAASYDLLTLHASGPIGPSSVTISDVPAAAAGRDIDARALPSSGGTLAVRVSSCLQWHGYRSGALYVSQTGGAPIDRLQLSGVG